MQTKFRIWNGKQFDYAPFDMFGDFCLSDGGLRLRKGPPGEEWSEKCEYPMEQYIGHSAPFEPWPEDPEGDVDYGAIETKDLYIGDLIMLWVSSTPRNENSFGISESGYLLAEIYSGNELGYRIRFPHFSHEMLILGVKTRMYDCIEHPRLEDCDIYYAGNIHENPELLEGK